MSRVAEANLNRQALGEMAKQAFLKKFSLEALRGLRGGCNEDELIQAVRLACVQDIQEQ